MKKPILKSVLAVAVVCVLTAFATSCHPIASAILDKVSDYSCEYDHSDSYTMGNMTTDYSVQSIDINWIDGTIEVIPSDDDTLTVTETSDSALNDTTTMHWYIDKHDGTLTIQYAKSVKNIKSDSFKGLNKHLVIRVPRRIHLAEMNVNGVSLKINFTDLHCDEVEINGVDFNIDASFAYAPKEFDVNGVDLNANLSLPEGTKASVDANGVSCDVHSDMPLYKEHQADCEISFNGVSCDIHVRPNKQ